MGSIDFNEGWFVGPPLNSFESLTMASQPQPVTLPHDALISTERGELYRGKGAFFPSAAFRYTKSFDAPEDWRGKHVSLHFDGAYRDAAVFVNGALAGHRPNGYVPFDVPIEAFLKFGAANDLRVDLRTHDDSRWYAGAGLYRGVRLDVREVVHVRPGQLHVRTAGIEDNVAVVEFVVPVDNTSIETRSVRVEATLTDPDGELVVRREEPLTVLARSGTVLRLRLDVPDPRRWEVDDPQLYLARVRLLDQEAEVDDVEIRVGLRTLQLDPRHGLRLNGATIKLRGACIHHDNGPLGAAAFADAEFRRIQLLKQAGFNAIRSAHNPLSEAMLNACDEVGMLVMDETFDIWTSHKSSFDYSVALPEWWSLDIEAMVLRDRNHPSVVFYSLGNEIPETGNALAANLGRDMAEKVRSLDSDRFVTNGINGFVAVLEDVLAGMAAASTAGEQSGPSGGVNDAMASAGSAMSELSRSPMVSERVAEAFAALDVIGLNYGEARYELEAVERPDRILVGSETYPTSIATNWPLVERHPQVLGDFTWTGWDYLGEVGIGRPRYVGDDLTLEAGYPWLTAWCGDLDITGFRRPASYFREVVFGLRTDPYIAVRDVATTGRTPQTGMWAWTDCQGSWTWDVPEGTPLTVEVYSAADEVELLLDGRSLGRQPAGVEHRYTALFEVPYGPGTLEAVDWVDGAESGRCLLPAAGGTARLRVLPEKEVVRDLPGALIYLPIEITDEAGTLLTTAEPEVTVTVAGPAVLQALASGRPDNPQPFADPSHRAFRGRLLAILRPTGPGTVTLTASAAGLETATVRVEVTS